MIETRHASTVAIGGVAVMIEGPSGSGKSDLALRLIDRGAVLVSDDYTVLSVRDGMLLATAPATIAGRIEVRGIGIVATPCVAEMPVALLVRLGAAPARMPAPATCHVAGIALAELLLDPWPASAPIKVELALRRLLDGAA